MTNDRVNLPSRGATKNTLALSDALVLVERVQSKSVGLCYIDPPLFPKNEAGAARAQARIMRDHLLALGRVLQQTRRCLAPSGNLFVHSEPEINGSIRLLLDQIFGRKNFRQEIIVPRGRMRSGAVPASGHDTVFHFTVGTKLVFNPQVRQLTANEMAAQFVTSDERGPYRLVDLTLPLVRPPLAFAWRGFHPPAGRSWRFAADRLEQLHLEGRIAFPPHGGPPRLKQYALETAGADVGSVWDDLPLRLARHEQANFPTQKPERLAERIIMMGSNAGDLILDPFCGSGTTLVAATKAGRKWIGGDNSTEAIALATRRLKSECGLDPGVGFLPTTEETIKAQVKAEAVSRLRIATGFEDLVVDSITRLVFGLPLEIEETREYEFKEVTSKSPYDAIANTADEYAVAFLNSEGGRIYWGVRNTDRVVVGLKLTAEERDRLRQVVTGKLCSIRPAIDPTSYRLEIHPVEHPEGEADLVVVELVVPRVKASSPYFTAGNESFVRLDGVKRKLMGPELVDWIVRRMSNP